ncbi:MULTISPECIES: phytanoyl-CoA dioxygenase [unclassified Nodularia (in: cyanobacteria)]|uniref:phytanoyl-CoA dioxygenase n=1 Tax=unclassified Nodularia (in: cyanobacteria) TaxID=2656917 RepID=UPI00187E2343|nr:MULTISPECIES: phytanoyl-CoA dioxygenase [unclassified Nodularia (in: cyanobacteria)]MBE9197775.1 phytanoyl-CoA dioxygenase [Nodularia sp. LEGE 06071]MCC2692583.1 phytanoyl-CoA dioxygenase [Nodularia sp. LEGE 04288]
MFTTLGDKFFSLQSELSYRSLCWQHGKKLPVLAASDRVILDSIKRDGIHITNLTELGLTSTSKLLSSAYRLLPSMGTANYSSSTQNPPEIFIVTDLPSFYNWGKEQRLFNIIENYIGLPVAYHGVHLRKDFANTEQFQTLLWHKDIEDRRILKIIIYLTDVEEKHGPFEYVPISLISRAKAYRIQRKIKNLGGIDDQTLNKIVPKSAWKSCPGKAGTVIFADTRRILHHGTLRTEERSTLFFAYTANPAKRPELCTHYWDNTYPRPTVNREFDEDQLETLEKVPVTTQLN